MSKIRDDKGNPWTKTGRITFRVCSVQLVFKVHAAGQGCWFCSHRVEEGKCLTARGFIRRILGNRFSEGQGKKKPANGGKKKACNGRRELFAQSIMPSRRATVVSGGGRKREGDLCHRASKGGGKELVGKVVLRCA